MADVATDNPAGRLHSFFDELQSTYTGLRRPGVHEPRVQEVLAQLWGLQWPQQRAAMLRLVADVSDLPEHVARDITVLSGHDARVDLEEDLESLGAWRAAVAALTDLSGAQSSALAHVSGPTQKDLRTCSRHLTLGQTQHRGGAIRSLEADALSDLTSMVNELQEQVLGADLDPDLKAYLSAHVEAMREALLRVRLSGPDALADLYARTTVDLARHQNLVTRARAQQPSVVANLFSSLAHVGAAVAVAGDLSGVAGLGLQVAALSEAETASTTVHVYIVQETPEGLDGNHPLVLYTTPSVQAALPPARPALTTGSIQDTETPGEGSTSKVVVESDDERIAKIADAALSAGDQ